MSDDGPTPEDFVAAAREIADQRARSTGVATQVGCGLGLVLLVAGLGLVLAGRLRPAAEIGAAIGAAALILTARAFLRSARRIVRAREQLAPFPELGPSIESPVAGAAGWLMLRARAAPGGAVRWLTVTFTSDLAGRADARWLPEPSQAPTAAGRRVWELAPQEASALSRRIKLAMTPEPGLPAALTERSEAEVDIAISWAGSPTCRLNALVGAGDRPEDERLLQVLDAGVALVDDARVK